MPSERVRMLTEVAQIVADREESYGPPHEHFNRTVSAINAVFSDALARPLTPADWAMFMILDKLAREQVIPKEDTAMDVAGYASCLHSCRKRSDAY